MILKTRIIAVFLIIIAILIGFFSYYSETHTTSPMYKPFKLGLDLNGGTHLVYRADVSKVDASAVGESMNALKDVIERRVNVFGVSEPLVQIENNGFLSSKDAAQKLIVELPGVTDTEEAINQIGKTPFLDFRILNQADLKAIDDQKLEGEARAAAITAKLQDTGLNGRMLQKAQLVFNQTTNQPVVSLSFNSEGRQLFAKITKENKGNILGIFLDGAPISLPVIQEEIRDGQAQISGSFDVKSAQELVRNLNIGALPVPIELISTQTIGASLGQSAVNGGVRAGLIAFIVIALFLILWYRLPGLVAVLALACYVILNLAIFKIGVSPSLIIIVIFFLFLASAFHPGFAVGIPISYVVLAFIPGALAPVTLTAAGIAGFILSIGMAVDANILIFERMKEELRKGKGISEAMHEGFARAWLSIRDSNISSILTGIILYTFGSTSVVTGFALVFVIGVLVSMFTAITASRIFLYAVAPRVTTRFSTFLVSNGFGKITSSTNTK
jgi:preprotein translocase subunit SecD